MIKTQNKSLYQVEGSIGLIAIIAVIIIYNNHRVKQEVQGVRIALTKNFAEIVNFVCLEVVIFTLIFGVQRMIIDWKKYIYDNLYLRDVPDTTCKSSVPDIYNNH